jgi:hypothetical protein
MYSHSKLLLAGLTAGLLMAVAVGSASANRLSVSNQTFRAVWSPLTFFGEGGISAEVRCPVTLEGSFHSGTIAKVVGALIGHVTSAISGSGAACARGSSTVLRETLPWHVTYEGFSGTLPRITRVRLLLVGSSFRIEPGAGISCRYGHATENAAGEINLGASGEANSLTADNAIRIRGFGEFGCPPEGGFEGTTSSLTIQGGTTRITIRLI